MSAGARFVPGPIPVSFMTLLAVVVLASVVAGTAHSTPAPEAPSLAIAAARLAVERSRTAAEAAATVAKAAATATAAARAWSTAALSTYQVTTEASVVAREESKAAAAAAAEAVVAATVAAVEKNAAFAEVREAKDRFLETETVAAAASAAADAAEDVAAMARDALEAAVVAAEEVGSTVATTVKHTQQYVVEGEREGAGAGEESGVEEAESRRSGERTSAPSPFNTDLSRSAESDGLPTFLGTRTLRGVLEMMTIIRNDPKSYVHPNATLGIIRYRDDASPTVVATDVQDLDRKLYGNEGIGMVSNGTIQDGSALMVVADEHTLTMGECAAELLAITGLDMGDRNTIIKYSTNSSGSSSLMTMWLSLQLYRDQQIKWAEKKGLPSYHVKPPSRLSYINGLPRTCQSAICWESIPDVTRNPSAMRELIKVDRWRNTTINDVFPAIERVLTIDFLGQIDITDENVFGDDGDGDGDGDACVESPWNICRGDAGDEVVDVVQNAVDRSNVARPDRSAAGPGGGGGGNDREPFPLPSVMDVLIVCSIVRSRKWAKQMVPVVDQINHHHMADRATFYADNVAVLTSSCATQAAGSMGKIRHSSQCTTNQPIAAGNEIYDSYKYRSRVSDLLYEYAIPVTANVSMPDETLDTLEDLAPSVDAEMWNDYMRHMQRVYSDDGEEEYPYENAFCVRGLDLMREGQWHDALRYMEVAEMIGEMIQDPSWNRPRAGDVVPWSKCMRNSWVYIHRAEILLELNHLPHVQPLLDRAVVEANIVGKKSGVGDDMRSSINRVGDKFKATKRARITDALERRVV